MEKRRAYQERGRVLIFFAAGMHMISLIKILKIRQIFKPGYNI